MSNLLGIYDSKKSMTGLIKINADTYNEIPSQDILYLSGLTSNVQQQINDINTTTLNNATLFGNNIFTGNNTFTSDLSLMGTLTGDGSFTSLNGFTFKDTSINPVGSGGFKLCNNNSSYFEVFGNAISTLTTPVLYLNSSLSVFSYNFITYPARTLNRKNLKCFVIK